MSWYSDRRDIPFLWTLGQTMHRQVKTVQFTIWLYAASELITVIPSQMVITLATACILRSTCTALLLPLP
jgi:hypothetical protein